MADFRLDRLTPADEPSQRKRQLWQKAMQKIEAAFDDLADRVTQLELDAVQAAADAADAKARNRMDDLPDVTIVGDYTGTIDSSQFPIVVSAKRFDGDTDVSDQSDWTASLESGDADFDIGAASGDLTINDASIDSVILITSTKDGLPLRKKQTIPVKLGSPPNTGSPGASTSWTDTTFNSIFSATMAAVSDELTVTVGSTGNVDLSAPLTVGTASTSPAGPFPVYGIWRWWDGAAWVDLGTEVQSSPSVTVIGNPSGSFTMNNGSLSVSGSKTGLTVGASEKFQLYARNSSGTRQMNLAGTASATTS